jgi:hypothetical protein
MRILSQVKTEVNNILHYIFVMFLPVDTERYVGEVGNAPVAERWRKPTGSRLPIWQRGFDSRRVLRGIGFNW